MTVTVAVVGSRDYPRLSDVDAAVRGLAGISPNVRIISGGARGVDSRVRLVARDAGLNFEEIPADWGVLGRSAGYERNRQLVERADMVLAFWDGDSPGTRHTINLALKLRKHLEVHFS